MNDVVERLRKGGMDIEDSWLRRMGPAHSSHINFRGSFSVDKYAQALLKAPSTPGRSATA